MSYGYRHEGLLLLLILRTTKGIIRVISALGGYTTQRLQLTILLHEAEHRIYDIHSTTWNSVVAHITRPKGRAPSSLI